MGYRSDVMALFYTYEANELPAIKLFIDENIPEFFRGEFEGNDYMVDSKWCCEFVRVGEEVEDIEEHQSYNAENLIYVSRTIESDV